MLFLAIIISHVQILLPRFYFLLSHDVFSIFFLPLWYNFIGSDCETKIHFLLCMVCRWPRAPAVGYGRLDWVFWVGQGGTRLTSNLCMDGIAKGLT